MGNLSSHFDTQEFVCSCCGRSHKISNILISRLEQMYSIMDAKAIFINSGYRCEKNPWGTKTDAHRQGIAADIKVQRKNGSWYTSQDIAEVAERVGFGGIGMMLPISCHVDTRDCEAYSNKHWFGNETTGENFIKTFQRGTVFPREASKEKTNVDITGLQKILNDGGSKLTVDGIAGVKTLTAVRKYTVQSGDCGNLIRWVQTRLNQIGYNCGIADGVAGTKTMNAIHSWQKDNNLGQGYLGGGDWNALLK